MSSQESVPLLSLSCREASRLISESLDRELTRRERFALQLHTFLCSACRRFSKQTRILHEAVTMLPDQHRQRLVNGVRLSEERRVKIQKAIAELQRNETRD